MKLKILITSAGGGLAPQFIRYFKKIKSLNIETFGMDINKKSLSKPFLDFFYKTSKGNTKKFLIDVKKIVKKNNINLIIPGSDEDALNLSKNRKKIENSITKIACVDFNILKILSNKEKTYNFLKAQKIAAPDFLVAKNKKDLINSINSMILKHKNIVIKPAVSRGGRNVYVIKDNLKGETEISRNNGREIELGKEHFIKKYFNKANFFPIIIMEYLKPPCYDFDMLCSNGRLIYGICRTRINSAVPNDGHLIEYNKKIYEIGKKLVRQLNLKWLYDCDLMLDKRNNPKIIEINPRMSGSASVSIEAGIPILEDLIKIYLNKKIYEKKFFCRTKVIPSISLFKLDK